MSNYDEPPREGDGTTPPAPDPGNSSPDNWTEDLDADAQQAIRDRLARGDT